THLKQLERGVYVARAADAGVHALRTCFQIAGDFDIVLAYEDLEINLPVFLERTGIGLATWLHNLQEDKCEVYRRNGRSSGDQRAEFEHFIVQPNGKFHYNGGRHIGEAATWGKLRLARRGDTIYALVAEFDSPDYRLITQRTVSADDVIPQGVKLFTQSSRYLSMSAVFTDLEIRAERLFGLPVEHSAGVVTKLNKQRENLQARKLDFRQPESYAEQLVPVGPSADPAQATAEGLRVKADSAGPTKWIQYTTQNLPASVVDAEVDLTVHQLDTPDDPGPHSEVVFETIFASFPGQPLAPLEAALILRQKANGVRTLVARVYRSRRGGGYTYLPIRSIPIQSPDRLRIAIDNKTIYFLYSETGSDEMKVLGEYFPETELTVENVLLNVRANGSDCVADVSWKALSIHHRDETP
ncbi:MAG TPA: DUF1583 domain-containing protein, partial [Planctomycetaceae bacterium]|nr:DUF1583 domain-containing protein [Planctomycetaceae bacterium]